VAIPATASASPQLDLRSPDTRDAASQAAVARTVDLRSPDARDAGRTVVSTPEPVQIVTQPARDGFEWSDAGIGAAGMLALVLLATSLGVAVTQRRRPGRSTVTSR
jgi:hypothetical protein